MPLGLQGRWTAEIVDVGAPHTDPMTIGATTHMVEEPGKVVEGLVAAPGDDQVRFSGHPACPGSGSYRCAESGNALTFTATDLDQCTTRTLVLTGRAWARA